MTVWPYSFVLLSFASFAQEVADQQAVSAASVAPVSAPSVEIRTDLHSEYLLGETMLVRLEILNPHATQSMSFPDLSARPWLVRFKLTDSEGRVQTRYNVAPDAEEQRMWEISPRSRREVVLEIPSSSTFKSGSHQLEIEIKAAAASSEGSRTLPVHSFTIAPANPVGGQVDFDALAIARGGHQVLWTHNASQGADLYLHHAAGTNPSKTLGNYHLVHLEDAVDPVLAQSSPQQVWDRHVYWMASNRSVSFARLRGQALRGKPSTLNFPYPSVELVGRGSTDGEGRLHIPFWVNAPNQNGGELRVASIDSRGRPRFRSVVRAAARPELIVTAVDSSGGLRILLSSEGELDVYKVDVSGDLPAAGARVYPLGAGVVHAQVGFLTETESSEGGMALGVVKKGPRGDEGASAYQVAWSTMRGTPLREVGSFVLDTDQVLQSVMMLNDGFWAVVKNADGSIRLWNSTGPQGVLSPARIGSLVPIEDGGIVLRRLKNGGPVETFTP